MTAHTGDLDHALADALHASIPHADSVEIRVLDRAADGTPTTYRAIAYYGGAGFYSSPEATVIDALNRAMRLLRAANGEGGAQVVDFAAIKPSGGTA